MRAPTRVGTLALLCFALSVQAQSVSAELPLDTTAGTSAHSAPVLACGATACLVAWHDSRGGTDDIYAARLSSAGALLDPSGIPVATGPTPQQFAQVAFDGANYLVVWEQINAGTGGDVLARRVSSAGAVLDAMPITLIAAPNGQGGAAVAFSDGVYLVAWDEVGAGGPDLFAKRVSTAGLVLDAQPIPLSQASSTQTFVALASTDAGFLAVWADGRRGLGFDVFGGRISSAGVPLDGDGFPIAALIGVQTQPAVAPAAAGHVVLWQDDRTGVAQVLAARLDAAGQVLDPGGFALAPTLYAQQRPRVAFDGRVHVVVFEDLRGDGGVDDVYGVRLDVNRVLDDAGFAISATPELEILPRVGFFGPGEALVTYRSRAPGRTFARLLKVDSPDAGPGAAGAVDAGVDGGTGEADAGRQPIGTYRVGCGCRQLGAPGLMLALLAAARRRTAKRRTAA